GRDAAIARRAAALEDARQRRPDGVAAEAVPCPGAGREREIRAPAAGDDVVRDPVAAGPPRRAGLGDVRVEGDEARRRKDGDPVSLAPGDAVVVERVLVAACDADPDADETRKGGADRNARPPAPGDRIAEDLRLALRRQRLVRVRVWDDPGAVAIPDRVADDDARCVRAGVSDRRERRR